MAAHPSVFVRNVLAEGIPLQEFAFKCPACGHAPLPDVQADIPCPQCGKVYPYRDGIYDFRMK